MIFLFDLTLGIVSPTFSLFVVSLGGGLVLVGALSSLLSGTRFSVAIPPGILSDKWSRKGTLMLALQMASATAYGLSGDLRVIALFRVLEGFGTAAVLSVGTAAVADCVPPERRSRAIGIYMACMRLGFALGGALGGRLGELFGFSRTYQLVALAPLTALLVLALFYRSPRLLPTSQAVMNLTPIALLRLGLQPYLVTANIGNFLMSFTFTGAVLAFLPLYANSIGISITVFGTMLAVRGLFSSEARIPAGILARSNAYFLMQFAIGLTVLAMGLVPFVAGEQFLFVLMCLEGIGYGVFITAGQAHLSHYSESQRGVVFGVYATFASMGSALGGLLLGLVAQFAGTVWVFLSWLQSSSRCTPSIFGFG